MVVPLQGAARMLHVLWQRFDRHQGMLRASALAFDTALGLVPLLALAFVVLKLAGVQTLLEPFIMRQLAGDSQETAARVLYYVSNVKVKALGILGLLALLASLFFLLENVRDAFNAVWDVREQRSMMRRGVDYLLLIGAAPLLLTVAFGMTTLVQSQYLVHWLITATSVGSGVLLLFKLTPFFCISLVLMLAYLLLPTVQVRFKSAVTGGLLTGAIWQMAHWIYFRFQFGVSRYNAMYGTLAMVPFLLIWIYTSWLLVLLGLEFVRWHQQGGLGSDDMSRLQES